MTRPTFTQMWKTLNGAYRHIVESRPHDYDRFYQITTLYHRLQGCLMVGGRFDWDELEQERLCEELEQLYNPERDRWWN